MDPRFGANHRLFGQLTAKKKPAEAG